MTPKADSHDCRFADATRATSVANWNTHIWNPFVFGSCNLRKHL